MRPDGADPVASSLSKIFCERASFELKEEDVQAYRKHIRQQAANVAAKAHEDKEYQTWKVRIFFNRMTLSLLWKYWHCPVDSYD